MSQQRGRWQPRRHRPSKFSRPPAGWNPMPNTSSSLTQMQCSCAIWLVSNCSTTWVRRTCATEASPNAVRTVRCGCRNTWSPRSVVARCWSMSSCASVSAGSLSLCARQVRSWGAQGCRVAQLHCQCQGRLRVLRPSLVVQWVYRVQHDVRRDVEVTPTNVPRTASLAGHGDEWFGHDGSPLADLVVWGRRGETTMCSATLRAWRMEIAASKRVTRWGTRSPTTTGRGRITLWTLFAVEAEAKDVEADLVISSVVNRNLQVAEVATTTAGVVVTMITNDVKRSRCAEVSFQPSSIGVKAIKVHDVSFQSIMKCDVDICQGVERGHRVSRWHHVPRDRHVCDDGVDWVSTINVGSPGDEHRVHEKASDFSDGTRASSVDLETKEEWLASQSQITKTILWTQEILSSESVEDTSQEGSREKRLHELSPTGQSVQGETCRGVPTDHEARSRQKQLTSCRRTQHSAGCAPARPSGDKSLPRQSRIRSRESRPQRRTRGQLLMERWRRFDHHQEQEAAGVLDKDSSWPCEELRRCIVREARARGQQEQRVNRSSSRWCATAGTSRGSDRGKRAEPTAGKRAKPTAGRSIKRNEKSRANCRQKSKANCRQRIDREEQLRAYPTAGTVWPESQDSEVRKQDEDGQGYQSDAEGVTRRQCEVHVSQEGQAQWRHGGAHVHQLQRKCESDAGGCCPGEAADAEKCAFKPQLTGREQRNSRRRNG